MEKKIDLVRKYDKKTNDICDGQRDRFKVCVNSKN